jgi:hypothetical protein
MLNILIFIFLQISHDEKIEVNKISNVIFCRKRLSFYEKPLLLKPDFYLGFNCKVNQIVIIFLIKPWLFMQVVQR